MVEAVVLEGTREILFSMGSSQSLCRSSSIPRGTEIGRMACFQVISGCLICEQELTMLNKYLEISYYTSIRFIIYILIITDKKNIKKKETEYAQLQK